MEVRHSRHTRPAFVPAGRTCLDNFAGGRDGWRPKGSIMRAKSILLLATVLAAPACLATPAFAQSASQPQGASGAGATAGAPQQVAEATPDAGGLEEIVVTARKRDESLQDVPIAVTAFSSADIKSARIERLADVAKLTPGLNYTPLFGAQNQLPIIRGAAQTFGALNVGVFLDGIYLSGKAGVDLELNDLERVEVIKGPQSALYGRNTFAGAINYVTARPSSEWTGRVEGTVGDHGLRKLQAVVSGPLADIVRIRIGGFYRDFNGFYTSSIDGGRVDFAETYGAIGTLEVAPSTAFTATLRLSYNKEDVGQPPSNVIRTNSAPAVPAGAAATQRRNLLYVGDVPEIPVNGVTVNTLPSIIGPYGQRGDAFRGALTLAWDVGPATITSVTSYDHRNTAYVFDGDNTVCDAATVAVARVGNPTATGCPNFGFPFAPTATIALGSSQFALSATDGYSRDVSQELRVASNGEGAVSWLLGGFYYDNRSNFIDQSLAPPTAATARTYGFPNQISTTKSKAVFGSLTFRPTERLSVTGELRYEDEEQTFKQAPTNGGATPGTSTRVFDLTTGFDFVTPRVIVDFKPADDVLIYASVARGVKTGGINTNLSIFDNQRFYQPEKSWNYEVGLKSDLMDNRLRLNLAGYYTDWQDQQVACQNPVNAIAGSSTQRTYVCNVGQARIWGVEAQATARISEFFTLSGNYAYTNARYEAFVDDSLAAALATAGLPPINFNGKRLPYVPDHKFTVSPQFDVPLMADYSLQLRGDVTHQSRSFVRADNLQSFAPKTVVDLRLSIGNERFGVQAFVNNLFDDATPVAAVRFFDSVNYSVASPLVTGADRRQFGVTLRAGF